MAEIRPALCRICGSYCPILVTVEDGRAVKVTGDPNAPLYEGYTCPKGRALPEQHNGQNRLLTSMKRHADGVHRPIGSEAAMDEIAQRVGEIINRHGPRAVALYYGTGLCTFAQNVNVAVGWMQAIGSPMIFGPSAIDKPGAPIAQSAHGHWPGGHPPFEKAEAWMLIGLNPIISRSGGFPPNNPGRRLKEAVVDRGMKLIVIDPRKTESAQRAHIHLQIRPGEDPAVLAAMIRLIIEERRYDHDFVAEYVAGLEALRDAVAPFTPAHAAARAGVAAEDIVAAARLFAGCKYAGIGTGVGPSFSLAGTLTDYLALSLMSLCGFYAREGDAIAKPNIMLPAYEAHAEPLPPFPGWGFGEQLRMRGLGNTVAGMPTGALSDEMLQEGEGQVRALFCMAGNPMMAWPDQHRAHKALSGLELLVTAELEMSATARLSDYVIAPKLSLEMPSTSALVEIVKYHGLLRGIEGPYARYAPAVVEPPPGSEVMSDWELYYGLAQRMGLTLTMTAVYGVGQHLEAEHQYDALDMTDKPTDDDLVTLAHRNARVPLDEVKLYPHGHLFEGVEERIKPRRPDCTARLDIGNAHMLARLAAYVDDRAETEADYPFLMVGRRTNRLMNSGGRGNDRLGGVEPSNPAFLNPLDLTAIGVAPGQRVELVSRHGSVTAIAAGDAGLRRGCVSITHGFGGNPGEEEMPEAVGCNVGRLLSADHDFDPVSGIPRIGGVPVSISAARLDHTLRAQRRDLRFIIAGLRQQRVIVRAHFGRARADHARRLGENGRGADIGDRLRQALNRDRGEEGLLHMRVVQRLLRRQHRPARNLKGLHLLHCLGGGQLSRPGCGDLAERLAMLRA